MNDVSNVAFFVRLVQCGGLTATAQELGVTPAAVSRRLGIRLLNRTTRSLAGSRSEPQGLLRVDATLGFGRRYVAPHMPQIDNSAEAAL